MRTRMLTLIFGTAVLLALAGCGPKVSGDVQDKRQERNGIVMVRELCLGDSKTDCTWHHLRGKYAYGWYRRCDVGERYPDCRALF
jgi:hypothetical protein